MDEPLYYLCYRATGAFPATGSLEEAFWRGAPWSEEFVDIEGDVRPRPRFRTRMKMLWDDACLYISAEMEEPNVWATITEHDAVIFQDNDFEVFIDPDGDNHDYYEIEVNALNTTWDLRLVKPYRDGGPALNEWEISGFRSVVHVDGTLNDPSDVDRGWSVAMAIPWPALGEFARCPAPPRPGDQWRINFSRVEWDVDTTGGVTRKVAGRPEHNWVWAPQGAIDMHRPERWGVVQFETGAPGTGIYRPDLAAPAREALMALYHAQREFRKAHGRWAASLADLFVERPIGLELAPTPEGWTARCRAGAGGVWWCVRQDSLLWRDSQPDPDPAL